MGAFQAAARCEIVHSLNQPILSTTGLEIGYKQNRREALSISRGLNLQIHDGELLCLVGPNGVGKSTLLRTITGLQPALAGRIDFLGQPLSSYTDRAMAKQVSVVLTGAVQVGAMRVDTLVGLGRFPYTGFFDALSVNDRQVVANALEMTGAAELSQRFVHELSDGERQKVMIARALAQEPILLALDEPTAFLDLPNRVALMSLLRDLAHQHGKAVLASSHDLDLVLHSADRVWLMDKAGQISQGAPEDLVLSGTFGEAFMQDRVHFDAKTGSFQMAVTPREAVILEGEGLARLWTEKALIRKGYEVLADGPGDYPRIAVRETGGVFSWRLLGARGDLLLSSVYELLAALQQ